MMTSTSDKQIFFVQTPIGLEALASKEIELKLPGIAPALPLPHIQIEHGGLTIELPYELGLSLNYWLKIPNRILLRFAHFKCRDIPKLFNKVKKVNWFQFYAGQDYQIEVSSKSSRLFDDRKIKKAIKDGLAHIIKAQEPKAKAKTRVSNFNDWNLFIRIEDDWCSISIDTSGERLGKRGYKQRTGIAPLRENLASALYFFTALSFSQAESFTRPLTIIDPFCGSGTLLMESALFFEPNLFRNYAFEFFPNGEKGKALRPTSYHLERDLFLLGSDIQEERLNDSRENFKQAALLTHTHHFQQGDITEKSFQQKLAVEIFSNPKRDIKPWLISNPPYGKRIERPFNIGELLGQFDQWGDFERIGLLLPREQLAGFSPKRPLQVLDSLDFIHGGDKVRYTLFSRLEKPSSE